MPGMFRRAKVAPPVNREMELLKAIRSLEDHLESNIQLMSHRERRQMIRQMASLEYELRFGGLEHATAAI